MTRDQTPWISQLLMSRGLGVTVLLIVLSREDGACLPTIIPEHAYFTHARGGG